MSFVDVKDAILLFAGFLLSIIAGALGASVQRHIDRRGQRRPLNQILNFGDDKLLFIFPHRDHMGGAILPRTSTEDFLAMNNFMTCLINIGWTKPTGAKDTSRLATLEDKKHNLVVICSPRSNTFAKEVQQELLNKELRFFRFERATNDRWFITDGVGIFESKSFEQQEQYIKEGVAPNELPGKRFDDLAVITKVTNPWNTKNRIIWIAGIRGIGTWAAAECLKKKWAEIWDRLPTNQKDADFSALVRVRYENCDITSVEVREVTPVEHNRRSNAANG